MYEKDYAVLIDSEDHVLARIITKIKFTNKNGNKEIV